MLHYIEFSSTYRYKQGDVNTNSKTIRLFTFLLIQELNFLFPVSLGHFWESGVVDSHLLKDKLIQVGLLWPPCQGASPATASGAAATLENLLCYFPATPSTLCRGGVCMYRMGCGVRKENHPVSKSISKVCHELNSPYFSSWPQPLLKFQTGPLRLNWRKGKVDIFQSSLSVSYQLLSLWSLKNKYWLCSVLNVKCSSLPVSVSVPFVVRHSAPPTKDWNLPYLLELGLACDWPWSAERSQSDGVSIPSLHLERPEHFHSLLAPQHTLEQSGLGFRLRKTHLGSQPVTRPAEPRRTALPRSTDVWRWPAFAWVGPRRTKEPLN